MLCCLFYFVLENSCFRQLEYWACSIILDQLDCTLLCKARMVFSVCFISHWKIIAWGSWNYELVQILIIWIRQCLSFLTDGCKKWQNYCKKIFLARQIKFKNFNGKLGLEVFFYFFYLFAIICACASQCTKNWRHDSVRIECASVKLKISTTNWRIRKNAFCLICWCCWENGENYVYGLFCVLFKK